MFSFHWVQIIFMQNLRENSFEIKQNLNWSESARINLSMVKTEWLFNSELNPKCPNTGSSNCFHLSSIIAVFHLGFKCYRRHLVYNDITRDSVTCSLTLRHVTENRYVKWPVHFFRWNIFIHWAMNTFVTNRIAGKLMNTKKNCSSVSHRINLKRMAAISHSLHVCHI